jgi:hypothetical protein
MVGIVLHSLLVPLKQITYESQVGPAVIHMWG